MSAGTSSSSSSSSRATSVFSVAVEVFLLFVLTTMLLMMYAVRIQHDDYIRETIERTRAEALEQVRRERLRELQKTIFVGLKRPPDHTYNMFVISAFITRATLCIARSLRQRRIRPSVCLSHAGIVPSSAKAE